MSPRRLSPPGRCLRRRSWPTGGPNARHRRSSGPLGRHARGVEREEATSSRGGADDVICRAKRAEMGFMGFDSARPTSTEKHQGQSCGSFPRQGLGLLLHLRLRDPPRPARGHREGRVDEIIASSKATSSDVLKCSDRHMASNSAARRARKPSCGIILRTTMLALLVSFY